MTTTQTEIKRLRREVEKLKKQVKELRRGDNNRSRKVSSRVSKRTKRVVKLGGLWAEAPEITEKDIEQARKAMWGDLGITLIARDRAISDSKLVTTVW